MNRKFISLILTLLFLSSCASNNIYNEIFTILKNISQGPDDLTQSEISKVPFASMQLRLGKNPNSLVVLEEDRNGVLKWTTSNNVKIYTLNGYIIRFTGLDNTLDKIELDKNHPAITADFSNLKNLVFTSYYSFRNPNLFDLPIKTSIHEIRRENILISGENLDCIVYEEKSLENLISWSFSNKLWVNASNGEIVKASQFITPRNPNINFKVTKKYKKPE